MSHLALRKGPKGRSVHATRVFVEGDVIEDAPVIVVPTKDIVTGSVLDRYTFEWGRAHVAVALGFGSLYNHSYTPNARYDERFKEKVMRFTAIRTIFVGDEITTNYNGDPACKDPMTFVVKP